MAHENGSVAERRAHALERLRCAAHSVVGRMGGVDRERFSEPMQPMIPSAARNALIAEHIGPYYVYLLVDPRTKCPFYVGKGTGERFRSHGIQAALAGNERETVVERTRKVARIRAIRAAGFEPQVVFARIKMTEAAAYDVEAALIDALGTYADALENLVRGQGTQTGLVSLLELEGRLAAPELATLTPAILIKLYDWKDDVDPDTGRPGHGYRQGMTSAELLESVRAWWVLSPQRAERYAYAVALHNGITRGVWAITPGSWVSWIPRAERGLRWAFSGTDAPADIVESFVGPIGRRVPHRRPDGSVLFGSANPIGYWPT